MTTAAVTTFLGNGSAANQPGVGTGASVDDPTGVTIWSGTAYVLAGGYLDSVDLATGSMTVLAGGGSLGGSDSNDPSQVRFPSASPLATDGTYVYSVFHAECSYTAIRRTSIATGATSIFVEGSFGDITYAPNNELYATEEGTCGGGDGPQIYQIDPISGQITTFSTGPSPDELTSIVADSQYLWVAGGFSDNCGACSPNGILERVSLADGSWTVMDSDHLDGHVTTAPGQTMVSVGNYLYTDSRGGIEVRQYDKSDGSWTTIAGSGNAGYVDGTGPDAWFGAVDQIATDGQNLYIADGPNNRVREASAGTPPPTSQGPVDTDLPALAGAPGKQVLAGNGAASNVDGTGTAASFKDPEGIAVTGGNAYVMDAGSIRKINLTTDAVSTLAGNGSDTGGLAVSPVGSQVRLSTINYSGLVTDGHWLYYTQQPYLCNTIYLMRTSVLTGATSVVAGGGFGDLTVGPDGYLYATDKGTCGGEQDGSVGGNEIYRINPTTGAYTTFATPNAESFFSITSDSQNLYVAGQVSCICQDKGLLDQISLTDGTVTTLIFQGGNQVPVPNRTMTSAGTNIFGDNRDANGLTQYLKTGGSSGFGIGSTDPIGGVATDGTALYYTDPVANAVDVLGQPSSVTAPSIPLSYPGSNEVSPSGDAFNPDTETHDPNGGSEPPTGCSCSEPVNTDTGQWWTMADDFSIPGRGTGLSLQRTYVSDNSGSDVGFGSGWRTEYNVQLELPSSEASATLGTAPVVYVAAEDDSVAPFALQSDGSYVPPARVSATLTHNSDGTWTYVVRHSTTYTFDAAGQLIAVSDLNGNTTTVSRDSSGKITKVTDASGRSLTFAYSGSHVSSVTDPDGRTVTYVYDASGDLTSVTDPAGRTTSYGYDARGNVTTRTDPLGHVLTIAYGSDGRAVSTTDAMGRETTFAYSAKAGALDDTVTVTDPLGHVTSVKYHDNELVARTAGVGTASAATTTYTYDPATDRIASMTDPDNRTWTFTYDAAGDETSRTDPDGDKTTATYNGFDEPLTVTDADGVTTTNTYDQNGNLLSAASPVSASRTATTTFAYGDTSNPGNVTAVTNPLGGVTRYSYDGFGQVTSVTDPAGDETSFSYGCASGCENNIGWVYSTVSPRGNAAGANPALFTTRSTYDLDGEVLSTTDPNGDVTSYTYDGDGNPTSVTSPRGKTTSTGYDADNEPTSVTEPDGTTTGTGYDADGDVTTQTDGNGNVTSYAYDALNRVVSMATPATASASTGITTTYVYDAASRLTATSQTSGSGSSLTTHYGYDPAGRQLTETFSDGVTPNVSYTYDPAGRRLSMTDGTGTTSYAYNDAGWLTSTTDGAGATVGYTYDLDGNPTSIVYPNAKTVTRSYNTADQLTGVSDWNGNASSFRYDPDGNLTATGYPNSVTEASSYDHADLVTQTADTASSATLASYSYTYDADNNLTAASTTGAASGPSESYSYNTLDQLDGYTSGSTAASYTYDKAGDPTSLADGTTLTYDAAQEPVSSTNGSGATTGYTEDARGNITSIAPTGSPAAHLGYDQANRLTSYTSGATSASYVYNGDGERVSKTVNGDTSAYVWDTVTGNNPLLLSDGSHYFIYGPNDLPIEQIAATTPQIHLVATGGSQVDSKDASSVTIGFSTSAQAGDQILLVVNTTAKQTLATPPGYTSLGTFSASPQHGATTAFAATATGGENSATVTTTDAPFDQATTVQVLVYRGVDPANPTDGIASAGTSSAGNTSITAPAVTTTIGGDELVAIEDSAVAPPKSTWTPPAGMTAEINTSAKGTISQLADEALPTAGPTGSQTATISGPGQLEEVLIALRRAPATYYLQHDQQGSTRLLTDPSGNVAATYAYTPYGAFTAHSGAATTPLLYDGQYQDAETGLYYLQARYYDPTIAGFLTRDPLVALSGTAYAYATDNPVDGSDPLGLWSLNPVADLGEAFVDIGTGAERLANWVDHHKMETFGIALGVLATATGVGALVAPEELVFTVGSTSVTASDAFGLAGTVFGGTASALDGPACIQQKNTAACAGFLLGSVGSLAGGISNLLTLTSGSPLFQQVAQGLATFGIKSGAAGTVVDLAIALAKSIHRQAQKCARG